MSYMNLYAIKKVPTDAAAANKRATAQSIKIQPRKQHEKPPMIKKAPLNRVANFKTCPNLLLRAHASSSK